MKRKFYSISKKHNWNIVNYQCYRSDMGTQVYYLILSNEDAKGHWFCDSYFIGEDGGKEELLKVFEDELLTKSI